MYFRVPEQPHWALMCTDTMQIVCVTEADADHKRSCGWFFVARESELLPFNPPRLIPDDEPLPVRRPRAALGEEQTDPSDEA